MNDFINKIVKTGVLQSFFSYMDIEFGGIRQIIFDFLERVKQKFDDDPILGGEAQTHVLETHEYIMF